MAGPDYGALGVTFKVTRAMQTASLLAVIGMTANFISTMVSADATPPNVLIGTLSVVCIAVLYCAITVILFLDGILPFLINMIIDSLFLVAVVVVAVIVGRPLSYMNCKVIGQLGTSSSAYDFTAALANSIRNGGEINYAQWIGASKSTCLEMKSIWGLSIALCVLFTFSAIISVVLWKQNKQAAPAKSEV